MAIYHEDLAVIELTSGNLHRSFLNHSIGSADSAANRFGIIVFRNGEPVDLTGVSCQGFFHDSKGNNIALTSHGTVSGNTAYVTLPQACYNYPGNFTLAIKLVGNGVTGTMRIVDGVVDNTNTGSAVAPTGTVPTYQEVLAVYAEAEEAIDEYLSVVDAQQKRDMVNMTTISGGYVAFDGSTFTFPSWCRGTYIKNDGDVAAITLNSETIELPESYTSVVIIYYDIDNSELKIIGSEAAYAALTGEVPTIARIQFNGANDPTIIDWNSTLPFNYTETQKWRDEVTSALNGKEDNILFVKNYQPSKSVRFYSEKGDMWKFHWNTMPAFNAALAHPWIWGVCGDVQSTSDNYLVMFHDGAVDVHTDGTGYINDMTWAQVQALNVDKGVYNRATSSWTGMADGSTAKIPLFADFLDACRTYGKIAIIECKCKTGTGTLDTFGSAHIDAIVSAIYDRGMQNSVAFMVSNTIMDYLHQKYPELYNFADIGSSWTQANIEWYCTQNRTVAANLDAIAQGTALLNTVRGMGKPVWGYASRSATGDYIQRGINLGLDVVSIFSEPSAAQIALATGELAFINGTTLVLS